MPEKKKSKYYVRPDGLHESIRTVGGKRVAFRGKSDREVDRKILEYREEEKRGRLFRTVADEWERLGESRWSESTRRQYAISARRLRAAFSGPVRNICPLDVQRYILGFEAKGYRFDSVGKELSVIKQILSFAVIQGDIDTNPAAEIHRSKGLPRGKRNALTVEQEQLVLKCRSGDWWLLGLMLLFTGCRRGELLALRWEDIDHKAGVIHINKKINYAFGGVPKLEHHLKSENGKRDIPLLAPLAEVLPRNRIGLIFSEDGTYLRESRLRAIWVEYCRDCGLPEPVISKSRSMRFPVTPHCFRHSFATICFEAGVDPRSAAEMLGDTRKVVEEVYQELRKGKKATSVEKLNGYFSAAADGE